MTKEGISCEFERLNGLLFRSRSTTDLKFLEKEFRAAKESGIHVELVKGPQGIQMDTDEALLFPRQAQMHPMKVSKPIE